MGTPAFEKDNPATRAAHEAASRNAAAGMPAGRSMGAIRSGPSTRVTTAAMRAEPTILPPSEQARRDSLALGLGIPLNALHPTGVIEVDQEKTDAEREKTWPVNTAREARTRMDRRLPDFLMVERFDLVKGVVVVDGMELPIPEDDQAWMRSYAIQLAADEVTKKLAYAMAQFSAPILQQVPPTGEQVRESVNIEPTKEAQQRKRKGPKPKVKPKS